MHQVRTLFLFVSVTSFLFMFVGLYKPWIMLWWEDVQSRRKVIKLYGITGTVTYIIYLGLFFLL